MGERTKLRTRWMIRGDMHAVCEIERLSHFTPWGQPDFIKALREKSIIGMVVETDTRVVAFTIYELGPRSVDVLRFAVDPFFRRRGVGTKLMDALEAKLNDKRTMLTCEVLETNLEGCLFLKARGWSAVRVKKAAGGGRDLYEFEYRCPLSV